MLSRPEDTLTSCAGDMVVYLVRHADAGRKQTWTGPDEQRPLTAVGRWQARALRNRLGGHPIIEIVSSPAWRCVQTIEPLAEHRALSVRTEPFLDVNADPDHAVTQLLGPRRGQAVWCTHGELLAGMLARLGERGAPIGDAPEWAKGSTWRLEVIAGEVVDADYLPPAGP